MPFSLNTKWSILGQTDELKPERKKKSATVVFSDKGRQRAYHAVRLFDEFGRVTPGPLENVVERGAQVLVVLSRLIVQEFLRGRVSDETRIETRDSKARTSRTRLGPQVIPSVLGEQTKGVSTSREQSKRGEREREGELTIVPWLVPRRRNWRCAPPRRKHFQER